MLAGEGSYNYSDACHHVSVLWAPLFDEELNQRGLLPQALTFLNP